jgi:hypothetical protein
MAGGRNRFHAALQVKVEARTTFIAFPTLALIMPFLRSFMSLAALN